LSRANPSSGFAFAVGGAASFGPSAALGIKKLALQEPARERDESAAALRLLDLLGGGEGLVDALKFLEAVFYDGGLDVVFCDED